MHPLTPRVWDLNGIKKKNKKKNEVEDNYNVCQGCYAVFEKTEECCPECGLIPESKQREQKKIENAVAVKDNRSLDDFLNMHQGPKPKEQWECKTLEELWQFKEQKGRKDYWVKHVFQAKVLKDLSNYVWHEQRGDKLNYCDVLNFNYKINAASLSETDVQAAIDKAWNSFYSWKQVQNKNNFKKSYKKY
jgi:hypothetical protein